MAAQDPLDTIPDHLKTKFTPLIRKAFEEVRQLMADAEQVPDPESDPVLVRMRTTVLGRVEMLAAEFEADGGTEGQWNILAPAIDYGRFNP